MRLIDRIKAAKGMDNDLDIAIEIALFEPDEEFCGVRANEAGTKVIFSRADGTSATYWARDFTLSAANRAAAIAALCAKEGDV